MANCGLISGMTFLTPLGSCKSAPPTPLTYSFRTGYRTRSLTNDVAGIAIFALEIPEVMKDFGSSSQTMTAFVVSVYVLGFAFGPLVIAPLSEIYGRVPVYHV
jgi:MFS family permease